MTNSDLKYYLSDVNMYSSKLIQSILSFSPREMKGFCQFVHSSFHNQHRDVLKLLEFIISRNEINPNSVLKKDAFAYVFPDDEFHNMRIIHVMSYLLKIVESYLAYLNWQENPVMEELNLVRSLRKRDLGKSFKQKVKSFKKIQEKEPLRDARFHYFRYQLELEHYKFISEQRRDIRSNLQEISNGLNVFFIAEKLKQTCEIISHNIVEKKEYELELLDEVLNYIEKKKKYLEIPAIGLYYYGYKILTDISAPDFFKFKDLLFENQNAFPKEEIKDLHIIAINFCIKQLNTGFTKFNKDLFELYQSGLDSGIFMKNGIISRFTFINAVSLGLKMNAFEWVQEFITVYKGNLDEKYRKSIFDYNQAKLYYEQKKYKESMLILIQTDVDDVLVNLDVKRMLLKMYYELGEFEALEALIESFRIYLARKKVIGYHKTNYMNILAIIKKLIYLDPKDEKEKQRIVELIDSKEILTEKTWLLAQLN